MPDVSNVEYVPINIYDVFRPDEAKLTSVAFAFQIEPDTTPPVVSSITPAPGAALLPTTSISLQVTDNSGVRAVRVFAEYPNGDYDVVFDGARFATKYANSSYREVISSGYRFTIRPNVGWTATPTLFVDATDMVGQENV